MDALSIYTYIYIYTYICTHRCVSTTTARLHALPPLVSLPPSSDLSVCQSLSFLVATDTMLVPVPGEEERWERVRHVDEMGLKGSTGIQVGRGLELNFLTHRLIVALAWLN